MHHSHRDKLQQLGGKHLGALRADDEPHAIMTHESSAVHDGGTQTIFASSVHELVSLINHKQTTTCEGGNKIQTK